MVYFAGLIVENVNSAILVPRSYKPSICRLRRMRHLDAKIKQEKNSNGWDSYNINTHSKAPFGLILSDLFTSPRDVVNTHPSIISGSGHKVSSG